MPKGKGPRMQCSWRGGTGKRCEVQEVSTLSGLCKTHQRLAAAAEEAEAVGGLDRLEAVKADLLHLDREREEFEAKKAAWMAGQKAALVAEAMGAERAEPKPEAKPAEDPVVAAAKAAAEAGMAFGAPEPQEVRRPKNATLEPEAAAHAAAIALLRSKQQEAEAKAFERKMERRRRGLPDDGGRVPIEVMLDLPATEDPSAMVDREGNELVPRGCIGRWVRTYSLDPDFSRKEDTMRMHVQQRRFHAQPVMVPVYDDKGKKTGETKELVGPLGRAVYYSQEDYAKRIITHSDPGAFDKSLRRDHLFQAADAENSRYGREAIVPYQAPEHGSRDYIP